MSQSTPKTSREISCKNFYFTVSNVEKDSFTSNQLFDVLEDFCDVLIVEKDYSNTESQQFNILLCCKNRERKERSFIDKIVFDLFGIDVIITFLKLKHFSTAIKSFKDEFLIFKGCQINDFNDAIKRKLFARNLNGKSIDILDPFIQSNSGQISFIEKTVEAIRNPTPIVNRLFPFKFNLNSEGRELRFGNWRDKVVDFFNGWIRDGWHHKRKHLCLYGESNVGKSTFCNALLGNYEHQNFPIGINDSKFAFDRWNPKLYTHCIAHEFDFSKIDMTTWKVALEGLTFKINRKHKTGLEGAIQVPFIFICNSNPCSFLEPALLNRIEFVDCTPNGDEKINDISDYLSVDLTFSNHQLSPEVKRFYPIGALKFPTSDYNAEPGKLNPQNENSLIFDEAGNPGSIDDDSAFSEICSTPKTFSKSIENSDLDLNIYSKFSKPVVLLERLDIRSLERSQNPFKRNIDGNEKINKINILPNQIKPLSTVKSSITVTSLKNNDEKIVCYSDSEDSSKFMFSLDMALVVEVSLVIENIIQMVEFI